ncbi:MAG: phosphate acyltransferase PlsX [Bacillales bacterium]|nr:phosphate acyltransferase PlsX [Bacillales bacterium]
MRKVIVDINGGDNPPSEIINGAIDAVNRRDDLIVILAGQEKVINDTLANLAYPSDRVETLFCEQIVTNEDSPTSVLKQKKESSLIKGMQLLSNRDDIDGIICVGNTGAVLVSATFIVGRVNKCRPTLATKLPNSKGGYSILVDCGANVDCKEEHLIGFAHMGLEYAKALNISDNPKVALLSNGSEEKKGNELVKNTHQLLKEMQDINFVGNVEGSNCLSGNCDVIVSDGFAGNILLKNVEGTAKMIIKQMIAEVNNATDESEAKAIKKLIKRLMDKFDFNSQGGAIILGVNKLVLKAHGVADRTTISASIDMVCSLAENKLIDSIKASI